MNSVALNSIVAFIQPFQLEQVVDGLRQLPNFPGMSVSEAQGFGRHSAHPPRAGERSEVEPFRPAVRIEIICRDVELTGIVDTLRATAHTGNPGDGMIFISTVAWAVRIRTGEEGSSALLCRHSPLDPHV
ncbi:MAG TPA: P-II family nitrogen regulator [Thermoanaerobaculia bacterium]|nr:P-II family nitrogen regulator [Thermoanaerobaculia bacterium]HQR66393.1 P-II family nitrogen regulator [Thermoanaerobaculia bacterium]